MYLFDVQTEHGEVIIWICTITVVVNLTLHGFYHILCTHIAGMLNNIKQSLFTKLNLLGVLGFVQSIGVDKQQSATDVVDNLASVCQPFPKSDGSIGLHWYELTLAAVDQNRRVMSGIAEIEFACW